MTIIRIGLDTSKHVFQIHGVDENEQPVLRRQIRRGEVAKFFAKLAPARIGIEACGASHCWARVLRGLGHEVMLLPPQYIKPYVKRGKNDKIDAEAICEAMSRPTMRFVPVKSAEQQAALTMLGVRDLLVKQRTMLINAIRGHAAEFGITVAKGSKQVPELLGRLASEKGVPALAREMIAMLSSQLDGLDIKLTAIERRLMAWHRQDQTSQSLATIPGIGPITGVSFALKVPDAKAFHSGRHFASWLGITPRGAWRQELASTGPPPTRRSRPMAVYRYSGLDVSSCERRLPRCLTFTLHQADGVRSSQRPVGGLLLMSPRLV